MQEATVYEWAGGYPALLRMTQKFYGTHVPNDDLLAPLFAGMSPDHPERVAAWLSEVFGGPPLYSDAYGNYNSMVAHHLMKHLTEEQRARWVALLVQSANESDLPNDAEFRAAFVSYLEWGSRLAVENSREGAQPPRDMPVPRWGWVMDATPWSRVAATPDAPTTTGSASRSIKLPSRDEPVSFKTHICPMFREKDRTSMRRVFDLWSYEDVSAHSQAIARRLREGTMPCDGAWPSEHVDVFERWMNEGRSA